MSASAQRAQTERAAKMAQAAREIAQQALEAAAIAENAAVAEELIQRGPRQISARQFDRAVQFSWPREMRILEKGKYELIESPISKLSAQEFKDEFLASLTAFCTRMDANWLTPEIEIWYAFEPFPKRRGRNPEQPHAMIIFEHQDDANGLWECFRHQKEHSDEGRFMEMRGQELSLESPNPRIVSRARSSPGSDTASEAASVAGSDNSHSSVAPMKRNMTLLFCNIPERSASSLAQRPSITAQINKFVAEVLAADGGMPIAKSSVKYSASFSTPKRAPPGSCWLNFAYALEGKRINTLMKKDLGDGKATRDLSDGKAYTFQAFFDYYRKNGYEDKTIQELWLKCEDAVQFSEKLLAGGDKRARPISIATYFMDRVKATDRPKREEAEKKHSNKEDLSIDEHRKYIEANGRKTWTTMSIEGAPISVEFMRMAQ